MIKVQIIEKLFSENKIVSIVVEGHSNYAESGNDIVCAGVSSVLNVVVNHIDDTNAKIDIKNGFTSIIYEKEPSERDNFLMNCFKDYILDVEKKYNKNIRVNIKTL